MPPRINAQTPGRRVTRASSRTPAPALAPLPAISTRISHAYGAPGKTTLHSQIATENADLSALMGSRTSPQVEREASVSTSVESSIVESPQEEVTATHHDVRNATELTPKAPYAASLLSRTSDPQERTTIRATALSIILKPIRFFTGIFQSLVWFTTFPMRFDISGFTTTQQSWLLVPMLIASLIVVYLVCFWGLKHLLILTAFCGNCFKLGFLALAPFPPEMGPWRDANIASMAKIVKIPPYDVPPPELEQHWNMFKYDKLWADKLPEHNVPDHQWAVNINFLERIERVEESVQRITKQAKLHNETMTLIHEMLPHLMVVERRDGAWEIPEKFWSALVEKLGSKQEDVTELWQSFLEANAKQIQQLNTETASGAVQQSLLDKQIVNREMIEQVLQQNYQSLQSLHSQGLAEVEQRIIREAKAASEAVAKDLIERTPAHRYAKMQAQSLAHANILVNTRDAMHEINYFSRGFGAVIDHRLTSPTQTKNDAIYQRFYSFFTGWPENPPAVALMDWRETSDCWCAAPSRFGKAQIGIDLKHKIFPQRLVVEHMPASGTLEIAAAPRELEVWARVHSKEEADRLGKYIAENSSQTAYEACGTAPTDKHVCIGKGKYDIHLDNWVQSFTFFANTGEMNFATDNMIVRVNKNWGADHTCLYRLRMTGVNPLALQQ